MELQLTWSVIKMYYKLCQKFQMTGPLWAHKQGMRRAQNTSGRMSGADLAPCVPTCHRGTFPSVIILHIFSSFHSGITEHSTNISQLGLTNPFWNRHYTRPSDKGSLRGKGTYCFCSTSVAQPALNPSTTVSKPVLYPLDHHPFHDNP